MRRHVLLILAASSVACSPSVIVEEQARVTRPHGSTTATTAASSSSSTSASSSGAGGGPGGAGGATASTSGSSGSMGDAGGSGGAGGAGGGPSSSSSSSGTGGTGGSASVEQDAGGMDAAPEDAGLPAEAGPSCVSGQVGPPAGCQDHEVCIAGACRHYYFATSVCQLHCPCSECGYGTTCCGSAMCVAGDSCW